MGNISKEGKRQIRDYMQNNSRFKIDNIIEIAQLYHNYDVKQLIEKDLKEQVRSVISQDKDSKGVRNCLSDNEGTYVYVNLTKDYAALTKVKKHLDKKYSGLNKSRRKVKKRQQSLKGQLTFDDIINEA